MCTLGKPRTYRNDTKGLLLMMESDDITLNLKLKIMTRIVNEDLAMKLNKMVRQNVWTIQKVM